MTSILGIITELWLDVHDATGYIYSGPPPVEELKRFISIILRDKSIHLETRKSIANYFYWHGGDYIRPTDIFAPLSIHRKEETDLIQKYIIIQSQCTSCGQLVILIKVNRTSINKEEFYHFRYFGVLDRKVHVVEISESLCEKCAKDSFYSEFALNSASFLTTLDVPFNPSESVSILRKMPYREYLQSTHWQFLRLKALEYANNACQLCNATDRLQVHHRTYKGRGEEAISDLLVLCRSCHVRFHEDEPKYWKYINA